MSVSTIAGAVTADESDIRLSGCLIRGHDGDGYLLTNVAGEAAWQRSPEPAVVPGPVGTSGTIASVFYWLDKNDGLDEHVGHVVEIEGRQRRDLEEGEIKIGAQGEWTDIEIEAGGRSMKARVPRAALFIKNGEREIDVLVRRVTAERVRMLAVSCQR
jgi:hypothetical protein